MSFMRYGSYDFGAGECDMVRMTVRHRRSPRGLRLSKIIRLDLRFEICAEGATLLSRIDGIIAAFSLDYQDAVLMYDASTPTRHALSNTDPTCISGVRVVHRSWDGGPDQLATVRTGVVSLEAEYSDAESQLVEWQETLEFRGTTGPRVEIVETYDGPIAQVTALRTAQHIVQSGSAVGYLGYVLPPGPLFPAIEHLDRRTEKYGSGSQQGQGAAYYPSSWTYYFTSAVPQSAVPTTR
jgi:hypothetical protein